MKNRTKTKLIILAILIIAIVTIMAAFGSALVSAAECRDSGTIKTISYSPTNLSVGMPFNLTYSDAFNNGGSSDPDLRLWLPTGLTRLLGNEYENLIDDGMGGGYFTWRLNSTANGTYTVIVTALYESTQCNVTRNITIGTPAAPPNLVLNYSNILQIIAKQTTIIELLIKNSGTGTAFDVNGITTLTAEGTVDTFNYESIPVGDARTKNFSINTDYCGIQVLESTANYKDSAGYSYPPSHVSANVSVKGSDLVIESFSLSDNDVKVGESVRFNVTVTNANRNTTIDAVNAIVKIYRGTTVIKTIDLGNISAGATINSSVVWSASGVGTFVPRAIVDSSNECSNWPNEYETSPLTIRSAGGGGGGGGGGGTPAPECGNGICEWGESYNNCPQDCKIPPGNETPQEPEEEKCGALKNDLIEISDDGMASLKIYEGTEIKINGRCLGPGDIISLRAAAIPYPIQNFYLVRGYNFLPDGLTFDKEAEVKIRHHKGEVTGNVFIVTFNPEERRWIVLPTIYDKEAREAVAKITHFSTFALVSTEPPRLTGAAIWNNITTWTRNNWWMVLIALAVIVAIAIAMHLIRRKK